MRDPILFDLDGTIADTTADIAASLAIAFDAIGIAIDRPVASLVDGSPLEEIYDAHARRPGAAERAAFVTAYRTSYGETRTRLFPGVTELLDGLAGRPLAIATSKPTSSAARVVDALGVRRRFELVVGSGASAIPPKPAPDLLLHAAERLEAPPGRCVMVGDTARDVIAGRLAGMMTVAVTWGMGARSELADAGPDRLVDDAAELLTVLRGSTGGRR